MGTLSLYRRHRFPAEIISHCVWLYFRFPLSFPDVEEMLATGHRRGRGGLRQAAELRMLKSQLSPHFLFNALNGVPALIADEPR